MPNEAIFMSPLGDKALLFNQMSASEALGRMPEYRLKLLRPGTSKAIKASELLGKRVNVQLQISATAKRFINGVVTRFEQSGATGDFDIYHVEIRPWLWHLTLGADCRIFQDKTVVEILDAVFADYGSSSEISKRLSATYRTRPFTAQYRESDFAFISRLMEEEGIYYYFKHEKDKHTLVLTDGPSGHDAVTGETLQWGLKEGDHLRRDVVRQWSLSHSLRSLKYTHTDYAAEAPTADLLGTASRSPSYPKPNDLEVFDYPGGYDDIAMKDGSTGDKLKEATRLAQVRVDAFESGHVVATGLSPYRHLMAGVTLKLTDHPEDDDDYLVTRTDYEMEYGGYESGAETAMFGFDCAFQAVPKSIKYQPEPITPRPTIHGPQTATVVGAQGDEILTDKYGRVKLQFRWDREGKKDEKSSCWVRVSHPWASKNFGMIALPRIGDEVVVEFLEGNPDRPLVTGRVYNGDNMPPYTLPAQATVSGIKTQSSKGGTLANANELRFDDKKGSEYVWFQAEKDFHQLVKHDAFESVQNDLWTDVTKNAQHGIGENLTISVGKVATLDITGDTHVKLGADLNLSTTGAFNVGVTDAVAMKGSQAIALTAGAGLDIDAGAALKMSAASTLHIKGLGIVIDGGTQLCIKAGGAFITLGPDGVTIQGTMVKINSGGSAGSASEAAKASPAAPKEPGAATENKDPLAS